MVNKQQVNKQTAGEETRLGYEDDEEVAGDVSGHEHDLRDTKVQHEAIGGRLADFLVDYEDLEKVITRGFTHRNRIWQAVTKDA